MTYLISVLIVAILGVAGHTLWAAGGYRAEFGMYQYPLMSLGLLLLSIKLKESHHNRFHYWVNVFLAWIPLIIALLIVVLFGIVFLLALGMDHA